ncbi:MAG TPA: DegQ family serine endoprotease [Candidatus Acidoferrum sp.]|nr:DegQ family serine endoprotease [Candidatus Acidoferrum sp.]
MRRLYRSFTGFVFGAVAVLGLTVLFHFNLWGKGNEPAIKVETAPINRDAKLGTSYAPVVKKAAPSVVNIYSTHIIRVRQFRHPFFNDPFFRQFFGPDEGREIPRRERALGSGVIVSPDGYILTANHVVEDADEIKVSLGENKKEYAAKVIGTDPPTDVAVLKIDAKDLPAITLADSSQLEIGDIVLAIGNPYGLSQTVTMGIVSALGRNSLPGFNQYQDFIQTDAAINPGNSGGALVDVEGRLVGINTAIVPNSNGGNQGIGFAVPVNLARHVMERLISGGKVSRGYLGIYLQDITPALAKAFNLPDQNGALVRDLVTNAPAQKAGIKAGDVIVSFNGKETADVASLMLAVSESSPGSSATVKLIRQGQAKTVSVNLAEMSAPASPVETDREDADSSSGSSMPDSLNGVTVQDLDYNLRRQLGATNLQGALVTSVDPDSNAAEAGLQRYDVILEINQQPVASAADAVRLGREAKGEQILLKIWHRGGDLSGTRFLSVDNTKKK